MNILTKIAVVVLVVLVLLACPVFIRIATVGPNYRELYEREGERNKILVADSEGAKMALARVMSERDDLLLKQKESALESARRIGNLENEVAAKEVKNVALGSQMATLNAALTKLETTLAREVQARETAEGARERSQELNNQKDIQIGHLDAALKEEQARAKSLQLANAVLLEEKVELAQQNEKLREQIRAGGVAAAPAGDTLAPVAEGEKIIGTVTAVDHDIVSVNVGSAKGVKVGMVLVIYRGAQFVAHLRIQTVDANEAAGVLFNRQADPARGDRAATPAALREGGRA